MDFSFISNIYKILQFLDDAGASKPSMTFGVLKLVQALGDRQALINAGRRVIGFHLGRNVVDELQKLAEMIM